MNKSLTKGERIAEISVLKQKIARLEKSAAKLKQAESQREAALEDLRKSEEKYRGLTENINLGIYRNTVGSEGRFIEANPAIIAMFGFKRKKEFLSMSVSALYQNPEDRKKFNAKMLKEGFVKGEELWLKKKDGSFFIGSVSAVTVKDERGRVKYYDGIIDNIDNRKRVESQVKDALTALSESEERFRTLYENSTLGIYRTTPGGKVLLANPALVRMLGYSSFADLATRNLEKNGFEPSYPRTRFIEMMKKNGWVKGLESAWTRKDRTIIFIRENAVAIKDAQGKTLYYDGTVEDISERKQAEKEKEQVISLQKATIESTADGILVIDQLGKITDFNLHFARMWRIPDAVLATRDDSQALNFVLEQLLDPQGFLAKIQELYATPDQESFDVLQFKDGRCFERYSRPQLISGRPVGRVWSFRDVSERKRAESQREAALEALRESELKYRSLIESSSDAIFCVNEEGEYKFTNHLFAATFGKSPDYFIGKTFWDIYPKEHADMRYEVTKRVFRTDKSESVEVEVPLPDKTLYFYATANPIKDETGKVILVLTHAVDITARKQAEFQREAALAALRESEERLQLILATLPIALFTSPIDPAIEASWISGDVEKVTGFTVEQFMAEKDFWKNRLHADDRERVLAAYRNPEAGDEIVIEYRWLCRDGKYKWFYSRTTKKRTLQGMEYFGIILDISERKQAEGEKRILEERLQWAEKMKAIGTLAGGIAHDFNNLLMGIQGYASMTLNNLDPSNPNYERLKRIEEQVQSGADLTRQLLGFARGGRFEVKPTDMNDIIEKTSLMFGRTKKEISMHRKPGKDLWSVEVDRGQMEQVFVNLYVNAWQAMSGSGEIYLQTENVLLNDEKALPYTVKPGKYVKISVTDNGSGMDEQTRLRVFDPFFTTKEMGRGIGLGLASVYGIIKGHQGMINVYSEPNHGTTFTIYLPASEKEVVKEKTAAEKITMGTETILLMDDEEIVLTVNKEMLESMGYRVYAADSGREGVAVYLEKRNIIDLVILDMVMPGMSGSETFDRLRKINPKAKVLLSSGYSLNGEAQHIMDRGCNGFLQKPFQIEKLSQKIRETLESDH